MDWPIPIKLRTRGKEANWGYWNFTHRGLYTRCLDCKKSFKAKAIKGKKWGGRYWFPPLFGWMSQERCVPCRKKYNQ